MRKAIGCIVVVLLLTVSLCFSAELTKQPAYRSGKPLYAKFVLDEGGTKVLTLAFDESAGTGKGYDTMYADLNVNGDLTDEKAMKGTLLKRGGSSHTCSFPPLTVDVPYNDRSKAVEKPWELSISIHEDTPSRLFGLVRGQTQRQVWIDGKIRLKDEAGEWQYNFSSAMQPAEQLAEASSIANRGKPVLRVMTQPDRQKKGNTGIAAYLSVELGYLFLFQCLKAGQPVKAHVLVKDAQGKTVHSEDISHEKLRFG